MRLRYRRLIRRSGPKRSGPKRSGPKRSGPKRSGPNKRSIWAFLVAPLEVFVHCAA